MGELCLEQWDLVLGKEIGLTSCMSNLWGNGCLLVEEWSPMGSESWCFPLEDALADTLLAKHTKLARKQNQLQLYSVWRDF